MGSAWTAYLRNGKRAERHLKQGTYKSWVRLIRRTGSSLNHLAQTRTSMVDQIAAVPATASDAATITGWLNYVRQEAAYESSAAASLRGLRIGKANKKSAGANGAEQAAKRTISGFGFQVCGLGVLA